MLCQREGGKSLRYFFFFVCLIEICVFLLMQTASSDPAVVSDDFSRSKRKTGESDDLPAKKVAKISIDPQVECQLLMK
jgi:hypothetical protein